MVQQNLHHLRTGFSVNEEVAGLFFSRNVEEIQALVQYVQELRVLSSEIAIQYTRLLESYVQHLKARATLMMMMME